MDDMPTAFLLLFNADKPHATLTLTPCNPFGPKKKSIFGLPLKQFVNKRV